MTSERGVLFVLDHVWGFAWAMRAMRLSHNSETDSNSTDEVIGPQDHDLAMKLLHRGPSHAKFLRALTVWATIRAPRYWWQQWSTYHFVEELSESTQHTILRAPLSQNHFARPIPGALLQEINERIAAGRRVGDHNWLELKAILPESFLQTRAVVTNYQTLRTVHHQRKEDPLPEWRSFEVWVGCLPYAEFVT
jgi:hypothetical protein